MGEGNRAKEKKQEQKSVGSDFKVGKFVKDLRIVLGLINKSGKGEFPFS